MAWRVEYSAIAERQLRGLDRQTAQRIVDYMRNRVSALKDPRQRGQALTGALVGLWRYRVGDYRVICDIQDRALRVLVVRVGRRDHVYR